MSTPEPGVRSGPESAGKPVTFLVGEGDNHFELHGTLGNPYGLLGRAVLEQIHLTAVEGR